VTAASHRMRPARYPLEMRSDLYLSLRRSGIDPEVLKELHRILLTTDGTVTDILEANFRERMVVVALHQEEVAADTLPPAQQALLGLAAPPGGEALKREIVLRGEISESAHLYATSVISLDRLEPALRVGLLEKKKPIGHLLLEYRIPTFKEIVEVRREPAGTLGKVFAIAENAPMLSRTYVMSIDRQPLMLITEKVPEFGR
jgi:chorismate-pyruvate lyase